MMKFLPPLAAVLCASCSPGLGPVVPQSATQRQMIGLLEKFDRWDDDGDGLLDANELDAGIQGLQGKPQHVDYRSAEVINFYDRDHDGKISIREAQDGYHRSGEAETRLKS